MEPMTIRRLGEGVLDGQIRIPAFQRDFVWEPERIALFIDSIYKQVCPLVRCCSGGRGRC